jgi:preprotein translocase subunit SecY
MSVEPSEDLSRPGWPSQELLRRLAVTVAILVVYRLGCHIPMPGIEAGTMHTLLRGTPQAIERLSMFALGIMPLVSALIVAEIAKMIAPALRRWEDASARNRATFKRYVVGGALILAWIQARQLAVALSTMPNLVTDPGPMFELTYMVTQVAGAALAIWLADQITRNGLGSGVWLLLIAGWLSTLPYEVARTEWWSPYSPDPGVRMGAVAGWLVGAALVAAVVTLILAGRRTVATAATCLWSELIAGVLWPWFILLVAVVVGGGSAQNAPDWLSTTGLSQVLLLAGLVAAAALLYLRSLRLAGTDAVPCLPPGILAAGLAVVAFADGMLVPYLGSGHTLVGRHVLIAAVAMTILDRWWKPPAWR